MLRRLAFVMPAAVLVLAGCTGGGGGSAAQPTRGGPGGQAESPASSFDRIPGVVDKVRPSVVTIRTGNGTGSGVIYKSNGIIVTNQHVVAKGKGPRAPEFDRVSVVFATGKRAPGRVVGADYRTDLAVVNVDRTGLRAAEFRTQLPQVGELAVAVGSPLGLRESATAGIISGVNRQFPVSQSQTQRPLVNLIQTDAPISPGSSGGALVNADAEVVGINELYVPPEAGAVALGFAIPSATVVDVAKQLLRTGEVEHAFFGAQVAEVTPYIAKRLGLEQASGVLIRDVVEGSGAARAGIQPGDVIVAVDGTRIRTVQKFLALLRKQEPGDTSTVTLIRAGQRMKVQVTLTDRPGGI